MSVAAEAWVVKHSPYTGTTFHVHKAIGEIVNKERGWLFYGRLTELSKKIRIDRKTIAKAIVRLVDDGYLTVVRTPTVIVEENGLVKVVPTGRPGVYRFVFVRGAAVLYDAEGSDLAVDDTPNEGGEEISSPPDAVVRGAESHVGVFPGHSLAIPLLDLTVEGGEEISAPLGGGEEIAAPGEEISSRGEESAARNSIELNSNKGTPKPPRSGGSTPRSSGTNPRALGTAPRDAGTNPRAEAYDEIFALDALPTDDEFFVPVAQSIEHAWSHFGGKR